MRYSSTLWGKLHLSKMIISQIKEGGIKMNKIEKVWQLDNLFDELHGEIDEARQQEVHAETIISTNYWRGYREGLERALRLLLKLKG